MSFNPSKCELIRLTKSRHLIESEYIAFLRRNLSSFFSPQSGLCTVGEEAAAEKISDKRVEIATACSSGHHSSHRYLEPFRELGAFYSGFQIVTRNKCLLVFSVCTYLLSDRVLTTPMSGNVL